ncbi:MAG: endonuclease III [Propionibacteriaceae bacterium]|jgi:endonuclease-3|nr:endonuclease III [Propionibacteriaceae bacterium]
MMARPSVAKREKAATVLGILEETYPDATCELKFSSAFQLLTATILSAQCTDRGVNAVTPELFGRYPEPTQLAEADRSDVERIIHSTGFYRAKTDSIIRMSQMLLAEFSGEVPQTLDELVTLPGVGRKTANVVLGEWFGVPGITTDTHVLRLSRRLGWSKLKDPVKVEADLCALFPEQTWISLCRVTIWHGRRRCHARRPACGACLVAELCPSFGEGEVDPVKAQALVSVPVG